MIVRATSDLHLTEATAEHVFQALRELEADAREHGGYTVLAGDIFDQATTVHMPTWNRLRRMLQRWPGDRVYVLAGNHDQYRGGTAVEGLDGLNCRVVTTPVWSPIGRMVPYVPPEKFREAWADLVGPMPYRERYVLWCHQGFKGAYRNRMNRDRDGVGSREIPDGHIVIAGHYHMPQVLGRVVYCGSPYQTSFAEEGQLKGWLRWDNLADDPIPCRVPFVKVQAPRHHTVTWDGVDEPAMPAGVAAGDIVRVKTTLTKKELKDRAKELQAAGLGDAPVITADTDTIGFRVDATANPRDAAYAYMLQQGTQDPIEMEEFADREELWG